MSYPIDAKFSLIRSEADTFRVVHQVIAAGETIPVYMDGKKIGVGISCSLNDDGYWAFDFGKVDIEKPPTVSLGIRFLIDRVIDLEKYDLFINPVGYDFANEDGVVGFSLLLYFDFKMILKPIFTPPSQEEG